MSEINVLVVDDDPDLLAAHAIHLKSLGYGVEEADNGQQALELVKANPDKFNVILSDILMPEMDGYELCQAIKADSETQDIPIIFVTQLATLEEKLKGFEVGADDYITKPISIEILALKIRALIEIRARNKVMKQQLAESNSVAMQAMTYSSDLGQILEFYKNTLNAESFEEVASLLFQVTDNYGLFCTLQIITTEGLINFSYQDEVSPLEANVIEMSRSKGRFFDFGSRTLINYDDFSLLMKNMPLDDPERYGILKDSLGTLCNAIEARVKFLLTQNMVVKKSRIVNVVLGVLEEIDDTFTEVQRANVAVINKMIDDMDVAMMDLGLTPNQEDLVRAIAVNCRENSNEVFKRGVTLYDKFEAVRSQLDGILSVPK